MDSTVTEPTTLSTEVLRLLADQSLPIGDVFRGLRFLGDEPIEPELLDSRSMTTVRRLRCSTWSDLAALSVRQILAAPSAGQLTVRRILAVAEARNSEPALRSVEAASGQALGLDKAAPALAMIVEWAVDTRGARTLEEILDLSPSLGWIPGEVREPFNYLAGMGVGELADPERLVPSPGLPEAFLRSIGERSDVLVRRRICRDRRPKLRELGDELGVTRERVRQLEAGALTQASKLIATDEFRHLRWRAAELAHVVGPAIPSGDAILAAALARASRGLEDPPTCTAGDLLLWLAGPYESDPSGWLVRSDFSLKQARAEFFDQLGDQWLLSRSAAADLIATSGLKPALLDPFLEASGVWRPISDDWWVKWDGAVGAKAEIVLLLTMHAMTPEQINAAIGEGHSTTSVRNALAADPRFVRLNKAGTYGLAAWGLEEYSGIAQEIFERIDRNGGSASIEDLVAELVEQFGVSENSVRMYVSSPAFVATDGLVRRRQADEAYRPDDRIDRVRGAYLRSDGAVIVQVPIDRDVLRGSGRQLPEPVAAALGLHPGGRQEFRSAKGRRVVLTWPDTSVMGPSLGSVRSIAADLSLELGDRMLLAFDGQAGSVVGAQVREDSIPSLTGLFVEPGREIEQVASAIRVSPMDLRAALQARGDAEVLALLPSAEVPDDLRDAIDEFGDLLG